GECERGVEVGGWGGAQGAGGVHEKFGRRGGREETDGDEEGVGAGWVSEAGGLFGGRLTQAAAPGIEGRSGDALFGAEGDGGQARAFKPLETLPPEVLKRGVRTTARTFGRSCRHEASPSRTGRASSLQNRSRT